MFRHSYLLLISIACLTAGCRKQGADDGHYQYQVASWQGTNVYSDRYKGAILKSRRLIQEAGRWSGLPGAQVAVAVDGQVCWSENFGFSNLENGSPVKPNTLFRLASVSKLFTASAVGKLVEQGKLNLDTPVVRYLPELPEHYSNITVRHLVSHQSGIRHYYGADRSEKTEHYKNVTEAFDIFVNAPLLFPPGEHCEYSSYGWVVASAVVERLSNKPFLQYMEEEVWSPMGLKNTFGQIPEARQKDVTTFYLKSSPRGSWEEAPYQDLSFNWGGAGFSSNANDLAVFGSKLLNGEFLKKATLDRMFAPQLTNQKDTAGFGIGFMLYSTNRQERIIGHGGFMPTARAYLLLFPDSNIVVAFTANTAMTNFADENLVAVAQNFKREKSDENCFIVNRTFNIPWTGLWEVEIEKDDGHYDHAHLFFYEDGSELRGTILLDHQQPAQLEVLSLKENEIKFFAILPAYTATVELRIADGKLAGTSYYDKPLTYLFKRELLRDQELQRMIAPKEIRNGRKLNGQ